MSRNLLQQGFSCVRQLSQFRSLASRGSILHIKTIQPQTSSISSRGRQWSYLVAPSWFSTTARRQHGHVDPPKPGEEVYVTFIDREKEEQKIACNIGENLLDIAQANNIDIEGACGGSCACSTCHVIFEDEAKFNLLPPESEDEGDMLDLAFGLTPTSRLGCQVVMTKELDGVVVRLPSATRNLQAKDFESK